MSGFCFFNFMCIHYIKLSELIATVVNFLWLFRHILSIIAVSMHQLAINYSLDSLCVWCYPVCPSYFRRNIPLMFFCCDLHWERRRLLKDFRLAHFFMALFRPAILILSLFLFIMWITCYCIMLWSTCIMSFLPWYAFVIAFHICCRTAALTCRHYGNDTTICCSYHIFGWLTFVIITM